MKIGLVFCALSLVATFALVGCSGSEEKTNGDSAIGSPDEGPDVAEDQSDLTSARVTLRIPILDYEGKPLSKHNAALTAAGLDKFPDTIEVEGGANGRALANTDKKWNDAEKLLDKANEQLNLNLEMTLLAEPYNFKTSNPATSICYKGNPKLVVNLITSLTDNIFSDQLSIHGWRYRQTKVTDLSEDDERDFMPTVWRNWRGRGAAILFVTASSDGGEETNVGIIPKCQ